MGRLEKNQKSEVPLVSQSWDNKIVGIWIQCSAYVIFNLERQDHKPQHFVEITLTANGVQHVSHEASDDMYTSLNKAVTKLEAQLRRQKEILREHHRGEKAC